MRLGCSSLRGLITSSYVFYANGRWNQPSRRIVPIQKGPAWIDSELYAVEAKAVGTPSAGIMLGPMMQALIEERFKLKLHTEYEEIPVYNLSVANGGHKLQPSREGTCRSLLSYDPPPAPAHGKPPLPICALPQTLGGEFRVSGATMADLAAALSLPSELVVDKTGLPGTFDVHVPLTAEFSEMLAPRAPSPPPGTARAPVGSPSLSDLFDVSRAIAQKLGLRLTPAKGQGPILVIDHVERPSEN